MVVVVVVVVAFWTLLKMAIGPLVLMVKGGGVVFDLFFVVRL